MIERERIEMFLDNLSASLLQICAAEKLSYEKAAEKCGCCSRHISNIIRRRSCPSIRVLEGICVGFQETPNQLLGVISKDHSFRLSMPVTEVHMVSSGVGAAIFPVCPQCGRSIERDFQAYCDRCGQCLNWKGPRTVEERG